MATADNALIRAVSKALSAVKCHENAVPMQRYMKSALPFYGVKKPGRVAALRPVFAAHPLPSSGIWEATVRALFDQATHREEWYAALALLEHRQYAQWLGPGTMPLLEHLIVKGAWWDIVDEVAPRRIGMLMQSHRPIITATMRQWATDDNFWRRRSSIIVQLRHKANTDTALLTDAIEANMADPEFFIRKAIGWALREYAKTDPDWVRTFVDARQDKLSNLSRREALKHLR